MAQHAQQHGNIHGRLEALAGHVAQHHQQSAVGGGLHVVEVSAHFVGRGVDRFHLETRSFELFLGNHQLLHAAGGGQFARSVLLLALYPQEADEDDEHDGHDAGPGVKSEGRGMPAARPIAHGAGQHGLNPTHQGQQQRNEQQAGLEVAPHGGRDQSHQNKKQPAEDPEHAAHESGHESHPHGSAVASHEQRRADGGQHWRSDAQRQNVPAPGQCEESDEKLEVEIGRDEHQLENQRRIPELVQAGRASRQFDKSDGGLKQLMQGQPKVFAVALLGGIKRQQKQRQREEKKRADQSRQALEKTMVRPQFELAVQVFPVA